MELPNEKEAVHQWQMFPKLFVCVIIPVHYHDRVRARFTVYSLN